MLHSLVEKVLNLHGGLALAVIFALPALEASVFLGFLVPGEIAVLLGGVLAFQGRISLAAALAAAVSGAIIGDQIGYFVGQRWGEGLLRRLPDRLVDEHRTRAVQVYVRRLGAKAVFTGRWTAALRALVPGMAGMAGVPYGRFLAANVAGGALWATTFTITGYVAGNGWRTAQHVLGRASLIVLGLFVALAIGAYLWHRRNRAPDGEQKRGDSGFRRIEPIHLTGADQPAEGSFGADPATDEQGGPKT